MATGTNIMNKFVTEAGNSADVRDVLKGLLNRSFTKAGLAIGSTNTRIKIANTVDYCIDGKFYTKAGVDNILLPSGIAQAIGDFCKYLVSLQANQTVTITQGSNKSTSALARIPDLPSDEAPVGYFEVNAASATYTMGDNLANGNLTVTYQDLSSVVAVD